MRTWGALLAGMLLPWQAMAMSLVLDSEFSAYCKQLTAPLAPALPHTDTVSFVLVADDGINAFVTPENVVHVNSGLFLRAAGNNDIQGVLAHEMGHVASQHLLRVHDNLRTATLTGIAGALVGVGAAVAGAPQVAAAAITGGQAGAIAQMLKFSRTQEQEADQRAIAALHAAGYSAKGMVNTFEKLRVDGQLSYGSLPPYLLTHPLPQARLQSLQTALAKEGNLSTPSPARQPDFDRISAKVYALTHTPAATLRKYGGSGEADRYAQAIARMGQGRMDDAAGLLGGLLAAHPADPFYQEMAAQIALERGKLDDAVAGFRKVLAAHPELTLVRYQLATALLAQDKAGEALPQFRTVTEQWRVWAEPWRGLGIAYGKLGKLPLSHLALAQAAIYSADSAEARQQLEIARNYLGKTPDAEAQGWADDIDAALQRGES